MKKLPGLCALLVMLAVTSGCDNDEQKQRLEEQATETARAAEQALKTKAEQTEEIIRGLSRAVGTLNDDVTTVSKDELKKMLPVEIPGMKRIGYKASRRGMEGFGYTHVESEFAAEDGDGELTLSITDIGNVSGFASLGLGMLDIEIDEENQDGFKRSGTYKGFKSYQEHAVRGKSSESSVIVFVGERFVAKAEARNVEWDMVDEIFDSIPVEQLPKMIE